MIAAETRPVRLIGLVALSILTASIILYFSNFARSEGVLHRDSTFDGARDCHATVLRALQRRWSRAAGGARLLSFLTAATPWHPRQKRIEDRQMDVTLVFHIAAGTLGLMSGFIALYTAKGAPLHRKAGIVFVYAMLVMCAGGIIIAAGRNVAPALNIPAALLTAALVVTALTTLRPSTPITRALDRSGTVVAAVVAVACLVFAVQGFAAGGMRDGIPAFPFVMFSIVAALAVSGDIRIIRRGGIRGSARLARHLWRMTYALWVAALSFFIGQPQAIPEPLRAPALRALPVLLVLATMLYWLWRVRKRGTSATIAAGAVERAQVPGPVTP